LREDLGLSQTKLSNAAGVSQSIVSMLEAGKIDPGIEVLARVSAALGGRLAVRIDPGIGTPIRDHLQAAMIEGLLRDAGQCWRRSLEVAVYRPVRGVIDLVLEDPAQRLALATEAHSELRRIEQQLRWAGAKADALAAVDPSRSVSRLLVLRVSRRNRELVAQFNELFAAAYPANYREAVDGLLDTAPWPGSALLWMDVTGGRGTLRRSPPRGVKLGR
jgi:transcriptional regulator with XRE-family HTH domain